MQSIFLVDSDHTHDIKTRQSITGLIGYVGSNPVIWYSKRKGSSTSSIYAAVFAALRTVTEEAQSLRCILRCLGWNVLSDGSCPTRKFGDNLSVILNSQNSAADLSKNHVAISFHVVRGVVDDGIIEPYWLKGELNTSDIMTKHIPQVHSRTHYDYIYWRPDFHLHDETILDDSYMVK